MRPSLPEGSTSRRTSVRGPHRGDGPWTRRSAGAGLHLLRPPRYCSSKAKAPARRATRGGSGRPQEVPARYAFHEARGRRGRARPPPSGTAAPARSGPSGELRRGEVARPVEVRSEVGEGEEARPVVGGLRVAPGHVVERGRASCSPCRRPPPPPAGLGAALPAQLDEVGHVDPVPLARLLKRGSVLT